jgi:hypothetical protein
MGTGIGQIMNMGFYAYGNGLPVFVKGAKFLIGLIIMNFPLTDLTSGV